MNIESALQGLLDSFSKSSAGLFEITGRYVTNFDQGTYGCAIAKPSKRMRSALSVDREILLSFPEVESLP